VCITPMSIPEDQLNVYVYALHMSQAFDSCLGTICVVDVSRPYAYGKFAYLLVSVFV